MMVFKQWYKLIIHTKLILRLHCQHGQTHKHVLQLRLSQVKKTLNLQADSIPLILKLFKELMMFLLTFLVLLIAFTSMVPKTDLFQILILSDGPFKPVMTYQQLLEMNQQQVVSDGKHLINTNGQTDVKKIMILIHNITGLLTTSVEDGLPLISSIHLTLFSQMETLIHGPVVALCQTSLQTTLLW